MALWLQNHRVTRFLNEDRQIVSELHQLITDVPPHMLQYHFNCNCGFREVRRLEHLSCYSITSEEYLELLTQKSSVLKRYC